MGETRHLPPAPITSILGPAITSEILESSPHPAIITMVLLVSEWEFITKPRLVINYAVKF